MSFLSGLTDVLIGGLASTVMDGIKSYFPPDMSEQEKAGLKLELEKIELQRAADANKAINEAERSLNERIAQQEGTAKDLLALPFVGRVIIFARGCQRPVWGFFTMYVDYVWFTSPTSAMVSDKVVPVYTEQQQTALIVINLLVLGFLFGERAVKNVMPLIAQYFGKK